MPEVVTFGEIMLRLAPEGYLRFSQADKFGATFGGGEVTEQLRKTYKKLVKAI